MLDHCSGRYKRLEAQKELQYLGSMIIYQIYYIKFCT